MFRCVSLSEMHETSLNEETTKLCSSFTRCFFFFFFGNLYGSAFLTLPESDVCSLVRICFAFSSLSLDSNFNRICNIPKQLSQIEGLICHGRQNGKSC